MSDQSAVFLSASSASPIERKPVGRKAFIYAIAAIIPGMMMVMIDSTAMNVAIPKLSDDLKVAFAILQWVIIGYMLAMSVTIPLAGWFSEQVGVARALIGAIVVFVIGSVLCAIAQSVEQLIIFRIIQGLGGGLIQPIGMAAVFRLAPSHKQGQVMGMLGIPMLIAPASGPILSGWLLEIVSWHWIFWINVPIGIAAIILTIRYVAPLKALQFSTTHKKPLDVAGLLLAPSSFVLLALALNVKTSLWIVCCLAMAGIGLLIWLWFHENRHAYPILELRAFRTKRFRQGMFVSWIQYMALNGSIVFIPQFLQNVKHYTPLQAGLVMSMLALTSGLLMPIGGRLFDRWGIRPLAITGLTTIAVALLLMSQMNVDADRFITGAMVGLLGVGMGLCMMSLNTYILQSAPADTVNRVTPLTSAGANLIIPLSIAGLSQFLMLRMTVRQDQAQMIEPIAHALAYRDTFMLAACIAAVGALLSLGLKSDRK
ncbi:MDR family MFS transporter [Paenibacillus wenxiniae]|uniref:MDR family MFS transporter n=1 Tax=Paenibacillus wenxiniae TaxID=1636843 RepID=A0ABW4RDR0_9BACL